MEKKYFEKRGENIVTGEGKKIYYNWLKNKLFKTMLNYSSYIKKKSMEKNILKKEGKI